MNQSWSVIIFGYNEGKTLSSVSCKVNNFLIDNKIYDSEIIVVDDGSDDGSEAMIKDLQKRIERRYSFKAGESNYIKWIETLLETPIEDYRKNVIGLILAPYLINIKKISYDDAIQVIKNWLDRCNELRHLGSNFDSTIKYSLNTAIRKQQLPMKFETLSSKNSDLHQLLTVKIQDARSTT